MTYKTLKRIIFQFNSNMIITENNVTNVEIYTDQPQLSVKYTNTEGETKRVVGQFAIQITE